MLRGVTVRAQVRGRGIASADADSGAWLLKAAGPRFLSEAGGAVAGIVEQEKAPGAQTRSSHRALADTP